MTQLIIAGLILLCLLSVGVSAYLARALARVRREQEARQELPPSHAGTLALLAAPEQPAAQSDARRMEIITRDLVPLDSRSPRLARAIESMPWQRDRHTGGAYAVYRPGQWFTVRPTLQRPHGKVLFAGEHLADWQGFMEGAVVTGEAAAKALAGTTAKARRRA